MHDALHAIAVDAIDALLPQTQCRRCGYDACRPYAQAIVAGEAINRCPPGGESVIAALAQITGRTVLALDPAVGITGPLARAEIDEAACIGCTLCMEACPVDAIVGGPKRMHAVIPALCTGCELCVAPCPVDCIRLVPAGRCWSHADGETARERFHIHRSRRKAHDVDARVGEAAIAAQEPADARELSAQERRDAVTSALNRARARRALTA